MKTLNELIVHLNKKNISNKLVNNQVLINRKDYNFCLINYLYKGLTTQQDLRNQIWNNYM